MTRAELYIAAESHPAFMGWDQTFVPFTPRVCCKCPDMRMPSAIFHDSLGIGVSHGYCPDCAAKEYAALAEMIANEAMTSTGFIPDEAMHPINGCVEKAHS